MDISRRDLLGRVVRRDSLRVLRLLTPGGLRHFLGFGPRPPSEKTGLTLRRTKKTKVPLNLLRVKHQPRESRDTSVLSKDAETVGRNGDRDRERGR